MAFSLLLVLNQSLFVPLAPPGFVGNLEVTVQATTAEEMTAGVKKALFDVQQQNVAIVANPDLGPDFKLTLNDVTMSGGGDGHTFVTTLFFVPALLNALQVLLTAVSIGVTDLSPEFFDFEFALAGTGETLTPLFGPMFQALCDASTAVGGFSEEVITLFNLNAGAAKGTRFMVGMGALIDQPATTVVRNPVDSTAVPSVASNLKAVMAKFAAKKTLPSQAVPGASAMQNLLGLKR